MTGPRPTRKQRSDKSQPHAKAPPTPEQLRGLAAHNGQPVVLLQPGEAARPIQIRGPAAAVDWFATLTPQQRGAIVAAAHSEQAN